MNISLLDKDNIRFAIGEEHEENRKFITERADATKPNESNTSFRGAVVREGDVTVARNYLKSDKIKVLNRLVVMWLHNTEDQAKWKIRRI